MRANVRSESRITRAARAAVAAAALLAFPAGAGAAPDTKAASAQAPVDINSASEAELAALPGIGAAMAKRIVEFRKEHGPFERVEDLMKVKGIGEKSFQKLRPAVTVGRKSSR